MYKDILDPLIGETITIMEDGTSQTRLTNNGRFGFYIERLFGIHPNSSQAPDLASIGEIKTVRMTGSSFKSCSIGTMSRDDWHDITQGSARDWTTSPPFHKMRNTLFVFYKPGGTWMPTYQIQRYAWVDFKQVDSGIRQELEEDYQNIRNRMIHSGGYGCADFSRLHNLYLGASYKGDKDYVYPSWKFTPGLLKKIYHA